jgi:tRNA nucleotidyltransferase (CCA-adding enzyme)
MKTEDQPISIPLAQLNRWTNATGATDSAQETHQHIRDTLSEADVFAEESECDLHTLLQGSYRTGTLVHGSGDVDILAINTSVWCCNVGSLSCLG